MKKLNKAFVIVQLITLMSLGCNSDKIAQLEKENNELRKKVSDQENDYSNERDNIETNKNDNQVKKYAMVVLSVTQREFDAEAAQSSAYVRDGPPSPYVTRKYNYCSAIKSFTNLTEDKKYEFLDEIQSLYLGSIDAKMNKGHIKSRQIFVFDTYEEASKEREQYMINN